MRNLLFIFPISIVFLSTSFADQGNHASASKQKDATKICRDLEEIQTMEQSASSSCAGLALYEKTVASSIQESMRWCAKLRKEAFDQQNLMNGQLIKCQANANAASKSIAKAANGTQRDVLNQAALATQNASNISDQCSKEMGARQKAFKKLQENTESVHERVRTKVSSSSQTTSSSKEAGASAHCLSISQKIQARARQLDSSLKKVSNDLEYLSKEAGAHEKDFKKTATSLSDAAETQREATDSMSEIEYKNTDSETARPATQKSRRR